MGLGLERIRPTGGRDYGESVSADPGGGRLRILLSFGRALLVREPGRVDGGRDDAGLLRQEEEPGRLELGAPEAWTSVASKVAPRSRLVDAMAAG